MRPTPRPGWAQSGVPARADAPWSAVFLPPACAAPALPLDRAGRRAPCQPFNPHDSTTRGSCGSHSVPGSVRSPGYACVTRSTVPYGPRSDVSLGAAPGHSMRVVRSPDSSVRDTSQTGGAERLYNFLSAHPCNVVLSRLSSETNCSKRVFSSRNCFSWRT